MLFYCMKNQTIEIKKMGINGEGIGYLNKKPVFVEGALIFEHVEIGEVEDFRSYYKAKLIKVEIPSKHRVVPPCPIAHECGACSLMHADKYLQQQIKIDNVKQALNKYAKFRPATIQFHSNPVFEGYRNQCKFVLGTEHGKIASGLFARNSNRWIAIDHCLIHDPLLEVIRKQVMELMNKHNVPIAIKANDQGYRYLVIRVIQQQAQVTLVSTVKREDSGLYKEIGALDHVVGVFLSTNDQKRGEIFGKETVVVAKNTKLNATIGGIKVSISPESFMQLNTVVATSMMNHVVSLVKPTDIVVEAFCGVGLMSLMVASKAKRVFGFDNNKSAIKNAIQHALDNNIPHAQFQVLDAKVGLKEASKKFNKYTLIVDPPRTGLGESFIRDIFKSKITQIIYVSCNPSTLAKDISLLKERYNVRSIDAFDMFSHTPHVETVCHLTFK
jgi:23S rRNA (uracil1939-C5)-methyltransferase